MTYKRFRVLFLTVLTGAVFVASPARAVAPCDGDCDGDRAVTVNEILAFTNIALGAGLQACTVPDPFPCQSGNLDAIQVHCLALAINNALYGCPRPAPCLGDCNDDGQVTEDEIYSCTPIVLPAVDDVLLPACCPRTVDGFVTMVNNHFNGCSG